MLRNHSSVSFIVIVIIAALLSACAPASLTDTPAQSTPTTLPPTVAPSATVEPPTELPPTMTLSPTPEVIELNPSPRGYTSMAYDSESGQIILFGGQPGSFPSSNDETWAYDVFQNAWTRMRPDVSPPRGAGAAGSLVYDIESDRIILYGYAPGLNPSRDPWVYDFNSNTWTKMTSQGPSNHLGAQMVYDEESDRVILFAGYNASRNEFYDDTRVYDFNTDTWMTMGADPVPPGRNFHCMAYNSKADRAIAWGGDTSVRPEDSSVWAYDFNTDTWEEHPTNNGPEPRDYCGMIYSTEADKLFMYGGFSSGSSDMWMYDYKTNTWTELKPDVNPGELSRFAMVYVPDLDEIVLFGGQLGDATDIFTQSTWVYDIQTNTWTETTRPE